jgi:hypothetical protein
VDASVVEQSRPVLQFWAFSKDCSDSKQIIPATKGSSNIRHKIHLTDSTKSRKEVLVHIFKPLLRDIFAFNVVSSIFDSLGIMDDTNYLLKVSLFYRVRSLCVSPVTVSSNILSFIIQCFGDWFVSTPAREAARKGLFGLHSPMVRWLQDMVASELDSIVASDERTETPLLGSLYKFCSEATDLVRAFFLATLCRDAISIATKKREAKTYGKVSSAESGT